MNAVALWIKHPLAQALGWTLLHFLWEGAALALLAGLLMSLLRGASPKARYAVACGAMGLMALLPALTFQRVLVRPAAASIQVEPRQAAPAQAQAQAPGASLLAAAQALPFRERLGRAMPWVLLTWLAGVLLMSTRLAGNWAWLQWLRRRPETEAAEDGQQLLLLRLCRHMGLVSNIRLLRCDRVDGPTVLGWLKPVILVPGAALAGLDPAQLELVLAHELAHILRHDYAINLLQSAIEVLFFYHPAVWWISFRIRQERELCCDDLAVRATGDALDYARALTRLETLRLHGASPNPALAMSATGGSFMHRIQRLISPTTTIPLAPRAGLLALAFLGLAASLGAQAAKAAGPGAQESQAPKSPAPYLTLRRYNQDTPDGKAGAVLIDGSGFTARTALDALARLDAMPAQGPTTDLSMPDLHKAPEPEKVYNLLLTLGEGELRRILQGFADEKHLDMREGEVTVRRHNWTSISGTGYMRINHLGNFVDVSAWNVDVDTIMAAELELEALPPTPMLAQTVTKRMPATAPKDHLLKIDLTDTDPDVFWNFLTESKMNPKNLAGK